MKIRTLLAPAIAIALFAVAPASALHAAPADDALEAIDEIVHQWEDGAIEAEAALEAIEEIVHDLAAADRNDLIRAIDAAIHDWEDGELTAEAALELIEGLLHGTIPAVVTAVPAAPPAPATTGNAAPIVGGSATGMALGLAGITMLLLGGARLATVRSRR
jgi:VIT1/CCC1 family predicted Fe2+/Mn2+ transporter